MFALSTQENNLYSLQTRRAAATPKAETNTEAQTATVTVAIERQVSASASLFRLFFAILQEVRICCWEAREGDPAEREMDEVDNKMGQSVCKQCSMLQNEQNEQNEFDEI